MPEPPLDKKQGSHWNQRLDKNKEVVFFPSLQILSGPGQDAALCYTRRTLVSAIPPTEIRRSPDEDPFPCFQKSSHETNGMSAYGCLMFKFVDPRGHPDRRRVVRRWRDPWTNGQPSAATRMDIPSRIGRIFLKLNHLFGKENLSRHGD